MEGGAWVSDALLTLQMVPEDEQQDEQEAESTRSDGTTRNNNNNGITQYTLQIGQIVLSPSFIAWSWDPLLGWLRSAFFLCASSFCFPRVMMNYQTSSSSCQLLNRQSTTSYVTGVPPHRA